MGCPTTVNGYTATWTRGKLSKLTKGSARTEMHTYDYTYNAFGRRTGINYTYATRTLSSSAVLIGMLMGYTHVFDYDHFGRLICETKTSRYYSEANGTEKIVYLYDETGIIGMMRTAESGTTTTYYFQCNLLGDVIGIYDTSGTKVGGYAYDAWGNCTITLDTNGIATRNPIRYRGYYYDKETKLYYLNARCYNPEWRRFISPDDTSYLDPESVNGLNLYAYCYNDPVNYADPSGHWAISLLAGLVIGGLVSWGLSELFGEHLVTGASLALTGGSAVVSGIMAMTLTTPVGWIVGGITAVAGIFTSAFASAELQQHFTGDNWMLDGGMSQGAYYTLMTISSITASVGTAASSVAYHYKIDTVIQKGRINGKMVSGADIDGYPGLRFSSKTGKVYSLEFHPKHNGHGVHIQWNQWFTTYPKFPGEYVLKPLWRLRLW